LIIVNLILKTPESVAAEFGIQPVIGPHVDGLGEKFNVPVFPEEHHLGIQQDIDVVLRIPKLSLVLKRLAVSDPLRLDDRELICGIPPVPAQPGTAGG
jgi:hypothetical protein